MIMRLLSWFMGLVVVLTIARPAPAAAQLTEAALVGTWVQTSGFGCGDGPTCKSVRTLVLRPDTAFTIAFGAGKPDSGEWNVVSDTLILDDTKLKVMLQDPELKVMVSKEKENDVVLMTFKREAKKP